MSKTAELVKQETTNQVIIKYDITEDDIQEMGRKYMSINVQNVNDAAGFNLAKEARQVVKNTRVNVEKKRKSLKEDALKYGRNVDAIAKHLTGLLIPIESHLREQEDVVKKEKERIKAEEQKRKDDRHKAQIKEIMDAGAVFNGVAYVYGFQPACEITDAVIWNLTDDEFELTIQKINIWKEQDDLLKAEEERERKAKEEESARVAEEQRKKQKDLDRKEREQQEKESALKEEQEKIETEKREFAEQKERDEAEKRHAIEVEEAEKKAAEEAKHQAEEDAKRKEQERIDAEKAAKEEAERQEALKPDKQKLRKIAEDLDNYKLPKFTSKKSQNTVCNVREKIDSIIDYIIAEVKRL